MLIDLDQVKSEWIMTNGQYHIRNLANHYGVFEHLFGKYAYFSPRVPMTIKVANYSQLLFVLTLVLFQYKNSQDEFHPVHYGNLIKPNDAEKQPEVTFDAAIKLTGTVCPI